MSGDAMQYWLQNNFESGLNYKDVSDPAVMVAFPLLEEVDGASMLAWTTTPWTLPSNLCLCVNANLTYTKVRQRGTGMLFIVAESWLSQLPTIKEKVDTNTKVKGESADFSAPKEKSAPKGTLKKGENEKSAPPSNSTSYEVIGQYKGSDLVGKNYKPLFDYFAALSNVAFKVVADDYVTNDSGTRVVHCAPAFGEDDYWVCLLNGIIQKGPNLPNPVDSDGHFTEEVSDFKGRYVKEADKDIIAAIKAMGRLVNAGSIMHSYPFCWRSDTPLIYKVVLSWHVVEEIRPLSMCDGFIVDQIKDKLVKNNKKTYWVPDSVKEKRFHNWLENARDWSISRSCFLGTPLAIWISDDEEEMVVIGSIQELEELSGFKATDLHCHHIDHITIPSKRGPKFGVLKRVEDVFDCWFGSGSMPYGYIHYPFENQELFERNFPGHFVAEGLDQTRGWFYTLMVLATALFDKPAFQNLICHGLVLAEDGKKMSKHLKNYPSPTDIIDEYGADALRLYLINSPVVKGEPLRFKKDGVYAVVKDVFLPWYNAYRFLIQNAIRLDLEGLAPFKPMDFSTLQKSTNALDRWINSASQSLVSFLHQEMEAYRLYTGRTGEDDSWIALSTLYYVLLTTCKAMAPFTPFFTETMFQNLQQAVPNSDNSVHYFPFPEIEGQTDKRMEQSVLHMMTVIDLGCNIREHHSKPLKTPVREMVVVHPDVDFLDDITGQLGKYVCEELNVQVIVPCNDPLQHASLCAEPDYRNTTETPDADVV